MEETCPVNLCRVTAFMAGGESSLASGRGTFVIQLT